MPEPIHDFPFAELGSPRRRLAVLVLALGLLGSGFAAGLPDGEPSAMRRSDCGPGWVIDAVGAVTADEGIGC